MNNQCGNKQLCWLLCITQIQLVGHLRRQKLLVTQTKAPLPPHAQVLTGYYCTLLTALSDCLELFIYSFAVYCLSFSSRM